MMQHQSSERYCFFVYYVSVRKANFMRLLWFCGYRFILPVSAEFIGMFWIGFMEFGQRGSTLVQDIIEWIVWDVQQCIVLMTSVDHFVYMVWYTVLSEYEHCGDHLGLPHSQ